MCIFFVNVGWFWFHLFPWCAFLLFFIISLLCTFGILWFFLILYSYIFVIFLLCVSNALSCFLVGYWPWQPLCYQLLLFFNASILCIPINFQCFLIGHSYRFLTPTCCAFLMFTEVSLLYILMFVETSLFCTFSVHQHLLFFVFSVIVSTYLLHIPIQVSLCHIIVVHFCCYLMFPCSVF